MHRARNFSPEWGYVAPAPSFLHTARIVVVAAAVGASAGAAVVFSLLERQPVEESVAARTLALPADYPAPQLASQAAESRPQSQRLTPPAADRQAMALSLANAHAAGPSASESGTSSTTQHPPAIAALAEAPVLADPPPAAVDETAATPATVVAPKATATVVQRKSTRKTRYTWQQNTLQQQTPPRAEQPPASREPLALLRPFGAYPRSDY